jgi:hypothetical protein
VPGIIPIRSIDEITRPHRIGDCNSAELTMREMLAALLRDSRLVAKQMCERFRAHGDLVSARVLVIGLTRPRAATGFSSRCTARIEAEQRTGGSDVK